VYINIESETTRHAPQKREVSLEILNYRKNGDRFWNLLSMMPVPDAAGNVVSYIGVQSDITELIRRKHAERELQEAKVGAAPVA
jgi:PAS domain S-box-containing protein